MKPFCYFWQQKRERERKELFKSKSCLRCLKRWESSFYSILLQLFLLLILLFVANLTMPLHLCQSVWLLAFNVLASKPNQRVQISRLYVKKGNWCTRLSFLWDSQKEAESGCIQLLLTLFLLIYRKTEAR